MLTILLFAVCVLGQPEPIGFQEEEPAENKFFTHYVLDRNTLLLKRRILLYHDELYSPWSEWGNCSVYDCTELRFRKCKNDSFEERITNLFKTSSCPFQYIAEARQCADNSMCKPRGPAEALTELAGTCGLRSKRPTPTNGDSSKATVLKILGGTPAVPHSWPWQVGLYLKLQPESSELPRTSQKPFCGATLLTKDWLVTAAHCLSELVPHKDLPSGTAFNTEVATDMKIVARLGDHLRNLLEPHEKDYFIETAIIHPEYRRGYSENGYDIALLKLGEQVELSDGVNTICLPDNELTFPEGQTCYAAGWGEIAPGSTMTNDFGIWDLIHSSRFPGFFSSSLFGFPVQRRRRPEQSVSLLEVELPLVSLGKCRKYFGNLREGVHICAGARGKDTCRGDSGGGLYCEKDGRWFLYGVTSFGSGRGCGKHYGVYTCLRGVSEWINDQLHT